jgi:sugar lactone lactonase YvrE
MEGSTDGKGRAAQFSRPSAVAADRAGNLYVADTDNSTIRKIVIATGEVSTLAGTAGRYGGTDGIGAAAEFGSPQGLAVDDGGNLYVADTYSGTIRKIVLATAEVSTIAGSPGYFANPGADGIGTAAHFNHPAGMSVDSAGNLYVADTWNATVRKIVLTSYLVTTLVGVPDQPSMIEMSSITLGPLPARLNDPVDVTVASSGELVIIDSQWGIVLDAH